MRPDRLSLFNYAHMPHLFKVQRQINAAELPEPQTKLAILHGSIEQLLNAGYEYIGMDHFALPSDELAKAQKIGALHRNFQGYTTSGECDLLGFGVSAINSVADSYAQNHKNIDAYSEAISRGELPLSKGYELTYDDKIRRAIINALACHFRVHIPTFEHQWKIHFNDYFAKEMQLVKPLVQDKLLVQDENSIVVCDAGRLLVRRICMIFDKYLNDSISANTPRYSRII